MVNRQVETYISCRQRLLSSADFPELLAAYSLRLSHPPTCKMPRVRRCRTTVSTPTSSRSRYPARLRALCNAWADTNPPFPGNQACRLCDHPKTVDQVCYVAGNAGRTIRIVSHPFSCVSSHAYDVCSV